MIPSISTWTHIMSYDADITSCIDVSPPHIQDASRDDSGSTMANLLITLVFLVYMWSATPFLAKTWHWSSLTKEHLSLVFISLRLFANRVTCPWYAFSPSDYQRRRPISRTSTPLSTCALRTCIFRILYIEQINLELTMNNCVLARTDMPTGAKASAPLMAAATTRSRVLRIILLFFCIFRRWSVGRRLHYSKCSLCSRWFGVVHRITKMRGILGSWSKKLTCWSRCDRVSKTTISIFGAYFFGFGPLFDGRSCHRRRKLEAGNELAQSRTLWLTSIQSNPIQSSVHRFGYTIINSVI